MIYKKMKSTGDDLSILGYGCMRFPEKNGKIDEKTAERQLLYAINNGVNYFDTAMPYHMGNSEIFLGKILKKYRKKIKYATKLPQWLVKSREDMDKLFNKQLQNLQTDYIDYYLIHNLDGHNWEKIKELGIIDFLDKIQKDGKALNIGFSFHGAAKDFNKIVDDYKWHFCQIQYNILDEKNQAGKAGLDYANKKGLGVIIMEPLRGGNLVNNIPQEVKNIWESFEGNKSPAYWQMQWIWNHPSVNMILSGMNDDKHIEENINSAKKTVNLNSVQLKKIDEIKNTYRKLLKINCTGCRYCLPCPAGVNIPICFDNYNYKYLSRNKSAARFLYGLQVGGVLHRQKGFASQCTGCGKCEKHCPQNIKIKDELKTVKKEFEGLFLNFLIFFAKMFMNKQRKKALS